MTIPRFHTPALVTALLLLVAFAVPHALASKPKDSTPPVDPRKLIKSVDVAGGTIEIDYRRDQTTKTYAVDNFTTILINEKPGTLADIKPGMLVADYIERDANSLDRLTLTGAGGKVPPAPGQKK